jgi:hypothetical protein
MSRKMSLALRIKIGKTSQVLTPPQAQSDITATAQALQTFVIEGKFEKVAAAKQHDQPLQQMQLTLGSIHNQLNTQLEALNTPFEAIHTQLVTIDTRLDATDHNNFAFQSNTRVHRPNEPLDAFHHPTTNMVIPNFLATAADIANLQHLEVVALLRELGTATTGTPTERMARLRRKIGLGV